MSHKDFDEHVFMICRQIPAGRVMTYGSVAAQIPPPVGMDPVSYDRIKARWVGYALNRCPDDVPWQRVINAHGEISTRPGKELQRALLEGEGIRFDTKDRVDLNQYSWEPRM